MSGTTVTQRIQGAMVALLLAGSLLAPAGPAAAVPQGEAAATGRTGNFVNLFPSTLEFIVDRGFAPSITEEVFLLVPAVVSAGAGNRKGGIYAVYEPEVEILSGHGEVNSVNHAAGVTFDYELGRDVAVHAGGSFLKTNDPARRIPDSVVVLPRGDLTETTGYAGISFQLGRSTSLEVRADSVIIDLDTTQAFGTLALDREGNAGTVALAQGLGRHDTLSFSYTFLRPVLRADEELKNDPDLVFVPTRDQQHAGIITYSHRLDALSALQFSAGALQADRTYFTGSVELEKEFSDLSFEGRYSYLTGQFAGFLQREQVEGQLELPLPPGTILETRAHLMALDLDAELADEILLRSRARGSVSTFKDLDLDSFTLSGDIRFMFRTKDALQPYVGFQYLGDGLSPGVRRRFVGGLNVYLFGRPSGAAVREERIRRRAVLPYGEYR